MGISDRVTPTFYWGNSADTADASGSNLVLNLHWIVRRVIDRIHQNAPTSDTLLPSQAHSNIPTPVELLLNVYLELIYEKLYENNTVLHTYIH